MSSNCRTLLPQTHQNFLNTRKLGHRAVDISPKSLENLIDLSGAKRKTSLIHLNLTFFASIFVYFYFSAHSALHFTSSIKILFFLTATTIFGNKLIFCHWKSCPSKLSRVIIESCFLATGRFKFQKIMVKMRHFC